jgi:hypothetical protein
MLFAYAPLREVNGKWNYSSHLNNYIQFRGPLELPIPQIFSKLYSLQILGDVSF